ncbi:MAG: Hsp20/alpha crystallin family protein [Ignavibacteriae bacterium]|nr:Hsp20/alpha crystallin family protein [Ignavibacteriota bacterium]
MERSIDVRDQQMNTENSYDRCRIPTADVYETSDAFVVMLDLPGVQKEGISLLHEKGELKVRAVAPAGQPSDMKVLVREVRPATFFRTFTLGEGIDTGSIDARFESGVLTVKLLKSAASRSREITIS